MKAKTLNAQQPTVNFRYPRGCGERQCRRCGGNGFINGILPDGRPDVLTCAICRGKGFKRIGPGRASPVWTGWKEAKAPMVREYGYVMWDFTNRTMDPHRYRKWRRT